jgi:5-methylcytosine-specific restriction enzyme subunit McrC
MLPTVELTERVTRTCRLAPEDVDFLLASHRAHLTLVPTHEPGRYRLTPKGYVGTVVALRCRLLIRPKIPLENLCHLLDADGPVGVTEDRTAARAGADLLDLLAARLARLMDERSAAGLHRAYVERAERGPFVQGRLDIPAQLRDGGAAREKVHCRYEDFTADVPCNQVPRGTAELVLRSPLLGEAARRALGLALRGFGGVSVPPPGPGTFEAAAADRLVDAYRPLLDLCRLLAESLAPGRESGDTACPAFLLDMERVFESYCVRGLAAVLAGQQGAAIAVQPLFRASRPAAGGPDLWMRPDFTLHRDGRPAVVVDAKWKRSPQVRADFNQVLGYCAALGFPRGVLVYPGRADRAWDYNLSRDGLAVRIQTLRVVGTRAACRRSLRRLARSV